MSRSGTGFTMSRPLLVHGFRCAVEGDVTSPDAKLPSPLVKNLGDVHGEVDVEFLMFVHEIAQFGFDRICIAHVVDGRAVAWTQKLVRHVLADNRVVTSTMFEQKHPSGDFTIAQQGGASHRVVEITV